MCTTLSYVHGTSKAPLSDMTVGRCFDTAARKYVDQDALVVPHQNIHWTWGRLKKQVDKFASGLLAAGFEPGQRVGIWAPNCWEWVVTQFAAAKAGLILVNINPAYRLPELQYALEKTACSALIVAPAEKSSNYIEMLHALLPELASSVPGGLQAAELPSLSSVIRLGNEKSPGFFNFADISGMADALHDNRLENLSRVLQFDDPINIQFTSGTTGTPKAATLTHHNIVNNALFVGQQMQLTSLDRMCIPVPMYHCFGMVLGTLCCVTHGSTMVFASPGFDAARVMEVVDRERCSVLHGVPTMFIAELEQLERAEFDLSGLRTGIMAGAPCPVELMHKVMREMHLGQITIAYGMTETGPVSFQTSVDDSETRRVNTVGQVLPHIEIKIVDKNKQIVPRGQVGELLTRGYCVMPGYWQDAEKTAEAIDNARWIASGDTAMLDDQGYCQIVGRLKDMLIRGGENIYPREIEEYLYTHPDIEQVEVIGVPDKRLGEQVCAWIKPFAANTLTEAEVRDFCKGKIAHFKIPYYIRFVDSFPMTVTGKVQKFRMREIMTEQLESNRQSALA